MGTTAGQVETFRVGRIEGQIEDQRHDLGQNLRELEHKVKATTDWRKQFDQHPGAFLGAAAGGGFLLAALFGRSSGGRDRHYNYHYGSPNTNGESFRERGRGQSAATAKANRSWDNIKGALIGVAATHLKDYAEQIVPGFAEHYKQADAEHEKQTGFGNEKQAESEREKQVV